MPAISYNLSLDLGAKLDLLDAVNKQVLPLMNQAVRGIAAQASVNWQSEVYKARLWSGEKDAYAGSIAWRMTGDFTAVVEAGYKHAGEIETGRPVRDLKKMLDTSHQVRRTTTGKRFLVIPFRHGTSGTDTNPMPPDVHAMASNLTASSVTAQSERPAGQVTHLSPSRGMSPSTRRRDTAVPYLMSTDTKKATMVAARAYAWGDKMTKGAMKGAGMDAATRKRYAGMVKMDTSTPGGGKSSAYLTFRIMMEGSSGWIVPAQPGKYIAKSVADELQPKAEAVLAEAMKRSLK